MSNNYKELNNKINEIINSENKTDLESLSANIDEIKNVDNDLLNSVKQMVGKTTKEQDEEEMTFGRVEVVYNSSNKIVDKYNKLNEDVKIDETKHISDKELIEKLNKFEKERLNLKENFSYLDDSYIISEIRSLIEASLYVVGSEGITINDIKKIVNIPIAIINSIIDEMIEYYKKNKNSGLLITQYGNKFKFVTKSEHNEKIGLIVNKKTRKPMSEGVIETLSIIAYNQPCTKSTIEKIRSKDCTNTIHKLLEFGLIESDGKSDAIGKPWLYSVTQKFFDLYGIKSLNELPPINREFKNYDDNNLNEDRDAQYNEYE
ncbi:MAG: SMC-Scp complex subunit ScpB [Candidatus Ureaplasma intestinipullorum]|uniref:SMC-Scp complex subunit ScpB n=1 Tax=Candidatus Ureaplasma intestinipullorum TaxID=2838770 RepID=A0A9E2KW03_9BACT|nr:SMC-Scp complex subunit ScpB [Candidatus Ureaplasma intestinipullorum]